MIAESPVAMHAKPAATPDFDSLARVYRWMEWATFGPFLELCRRSFLREMRPCKRALVIGEGDGRFTARLLRESSEIKIDAMDASPAMLRAMIRRAGNHTNRLHTHCIDARDWHPDGRAYDLIVTHFFLDCLTSEEVRSLAERVRAAAEPGTIWIISEFAMPTSWFGRLLARPLIGALYMAFGWITGLSIRRLPDHANALERCGFHRVQRHSRLAGLLVSEVWAA